MRYWIVFTPLALGLGIAFYVLLDRYVPWPGYVVWVTAASAVTFLLYGLDKGLAKTAMGRSPEGLLNLLALLGGFPGAMLGMAVWHHKTNVRKHWDMWAVLVLAVLLHAALIDYLFFRKGG